MEGGKAVDTLKRALSPVCYALFVGAVCLVCDLINERVYAGAINSLAFNLTTFWAVFFLLPRPMYDEDTGRLRWRFAALIVFRLGKVKFAAMVLVLVAGIAVTAAHWPQCTVAEVEARLAAQGYSDIERHITLDGESPLQPGRVVLEAESPEGYTEYLLADLSDGSVEPWT